MPNARPKPPLKNGRREQTTERIYFAHPIGFTVLLYRALSILSASTGISDRTNSPAGFTILPFLTSFSAPAGLYRQLVRQSTNLLALTFFTDFSAPVGLYRQLVRQSMNLPVLAPLQVYTAN